MRSAQKSLAYIEPEEYLLLEANSKEKHEYMDGAIYAWQGSDVRGMAGASADHARVVMNIYASLREQIDPARCELFIMDVRLRPHERSAWFYPDLMARCGPALAGDAMEVSDACLIVEVLSDSTENFDRQDKFDRYRLMPTLQTYVLVSPARRSIEIFRADRDWRLEYASAADASVELGVNDWSLQRADIFEGLRSAEVPT